MRRGLRRGTCCPVGARPARSGRVSAALCRRHPCRIRLRPCRRSRRPCPTILATDRVRCPCRTSRGRPLRCRYVRVRGRFGPARRMFSSGSMPRQALAGSRPSATWRGSPVSQAQTEDRTARPRGGSGGRHVASWCLRWRLRRGDRPRRGDRSGCSIACPGLIGVAGGTEHQAKRRGRFRGSASSSDAAAATPDRAFETESTSWAGSVSKSGAGVRSIASAPTAGLAISRKLTLSGIVLAGARRAREP